jgi:hypothetical protein
VREAFPSPATGTALTGGRVEDARPLRIRSEMSEGGVVFGDGIEDDRLSFGWGVGARIGVAAQSLSLAV